jgi:hypothetical protein
MPRLEMPRLEMPRLELPRLEIPRLEELFAIWTSLFLSNHDDK